MIAAAVCAVIRLGWSLVGMRQTTSPPITSLSRTQRSGLQDDERFSEVLDFRLEAFHHLFVPASTFRFSVFEGAVHPVPRGAAAPADEQVGRGVGQAVEHGVVRRADRTAKVGLAGPLGAELHQAAGGVSIKSREFTAQVLRVPALACSTSYSGRIALAAGMGKDEALPIPSAPPPAGAARTGRRCSLSPQHAHSAVKVIAGGRRNRA